MVLLLQDTHTQTHTIGGMGFSYFLSVQEKKDFFTSGLENFHSGLFVWESAYLLLWAFNTLWLYLYL